MKNLLILLALGVIYFIFNPDKKKKATKSTPPLFRPNPAKEPAYNTRPSSPNFTQPYTKPPEPQRVNEKSYFTYETIESSQEDLFYQDELMSQKRKKIENEELVEKEVENVIKIDFNQENFYQGIIFSEILKRPYN